MVDVKILQQEKYNGIVIFLKKIVMFEQERAGDRIRIMKYYIKLCDDKKKADFDIEYVGLDQEQAIELYELMNEKL